MNAGHPPAYLLDGRGCVKASLDSTCIPVGIMADASVPEARTVESAPGDTLICATDGVTEVESSDGVPFGSDRLLDVVRSSADRSAAEIIRALWEAMCQFCGRSTFADDATAVVVKALDGPTNAP